ncbi:MAG: RNA polymerase sigma factor [Bryobacterales bacterium]|nr:RNA polymerase sigma factor [Bryobacterales bacterium]
MDDTLTGSDYLLSKRSDSHLVEEWVCAQYEKLGPGLRRYLLRLTGDPGHAEDFVQETFLRLYEEVLKNRKVKRLRPWIFQVGHNLAIDFLRRRGQEEWVHEERRDTEYPDTAPSAEAAMLAAERHRQIRDGLYLLSPQERQVLELRAEGLLYREIAGLMGLQVSTVTTCLSRAVQKIARQIHG